MAVNCNPKLALAIQRRLLDDQADVRKQLPVAPTTTGFCNAGRETPSHNNNRLQAAIAPSVTNNDYLIKSAGIGHLLMIAIHG